MISNSVLKSEGFNPKSGFNLHFSGLNPSIEDSVLHIATARQGAHQTDVPAGKLVSNVLPISVIKSQ